MALGLGSTAIVGESSAGSDSRTINGPRSRITSPSARLCAVSRSESDGPEGPAGDRDDAEGQGRPVLRQLPRRVPDGQEGRHGHVLGQPQERLHRRFGGGDEGRECTTETRVAGGEEQVPHERVDRGARYDGDPVDSSGEIAADPPDAAPDDN